VSYPLVSSPLAEESFHGAVRCPIQRIIVAVQCAAVTEDFALAATLLSVSKGGS